MLDRAVSCQVAEGEAAELAKEDVRAEGEEDGEREREMEPFAESGDELGGMDVAPVVWEVSVVREGVERGAGRTGVCRLSWHELVARSRKSDWWVSLPWKEEPTGYNGRDEENEQVYDVEKAAVEAGA